MAKVQDGNKILLKVSAPE